MGTTWILIEKYGFDTDSVWSPCGPCVVRFALFRFLSRWFILFFVSCLCWLFKKLFRVLAPRWNCLILFIDDLMIAIDVLMLFICFS